MMTGFEQYTRKTRRAIFLEEMEQVVPWRRLCRVVEPHYPKSGNGRPPVEVERMPADLLFAAVRSRTAPSSTIRLRVNCWVSPF
jgi:hypothetical protein